MTTFVFANNVNTTLASAASSSSTTLTLASSTNLPTLSAGQTFPLTLNDAATGAVYEIVYVTAISGVTLTVVRAQEGTGAQNWSVGDYAFSTLTAAGMNTPGFPNSPTAPTPTLGDNSTKLATTQYVESGILGSASQAWTDETASRAFSTVYTNSTNRPIQVNVQALSTAATTSVGISVSGSTNVSYVGANTTGAAMEASAIVPIGQTYEALATGANLSKWWELK